MQKVLKRKNNKMNQEESFSGFMPMINQIS